MPRIVSAALEASALTGLKAPLRIFAPRTHFGQGSAQGSPETPPNLTRSRRTAIEDGSQGEHQGAAPWCFLQSDPILRALIGTTGSGLVIVDCHDRIINGSEVAHEILGVPSESLNGLPVKNLAFPALTDLVHASMRDTSITLTTHTIAPMTGISLELRVRAIQDTDGSVCGALAVLRDRRIEHELAQMKADFLATVSHELRTPLTSILGYSSLLIEAADAIDGQERSHFLQTIDTQGRVLLELINDLIEMTKLDAADAEIHPEDCDIARVISAVVEEHNQRALQHDLELESVCDAPFTPPLCDSQRVRQALGYILDNAIKFTGAGGKVSVQAFEEDGDVVFQVTDTGIGVPAEHLDRLFERFYQADSGASRRVGGTGLGLAIVKRIVDLHQGQVFVSSTHGVGSVFGFRIPAGSQESYGSCMPEGPMEDLLVCLRPGGFGEESLAGLSCNRASSLPQVRSWLRGRDRGCMLLDVSFADSNRHMFQCALDSAAAHELRVILCGSIGGQMVAPFAVDFCSSAELPADFEARMSALCMPESNRQVVLASADGVGEDVLLDAFLTAGWTVKVAHARWSLHRLLEKDQVGLLAVHCCSSDMHDLALVSSLRRVGYEGNLTVFLANPSASPRQLAGWLAGFSAEKPADADSAKASLLTLLRQPPPDRSVRRAA